MSIPLTTTFNPPSQCTQDIWSMESYQLLGGTGYSSCLPPSYIPTSLFYYSPGLYCPNGYSSACISSEVVGAETATIVTCCPSGYSCQTDPSVDYLSTLGCTSAVSSTFWTALMASTGIIDILDGPGAGANAYSVQIRFRSADLATTTSTSASSLSSSPSSSTPTSNIATNTATMTSATSSSTATGAPLHTGLSAGAKAGIAVGVMLGVALVAAIVYLAWNIGKRSSNQRPSGGINLPELVQPPYTVYGTKAPDPGMQVVGHPQ